MDANRQVTLANFVIAPDLLAEMELHPEKPIAVIVSFQERLNRTNPASMAQQPAAEERKGTGGLADSKNTVRQYLEALGHKCHESEFYLFCSLQAAEIRRVANEHPLLVYQIWMDHEVSAHLLTSTNTIKASACWRTYEARGKGITWAVLDTGIDVDHPHFAGDTIDLDLSASCLLDDDTIKDSNGHGSHVAGIIAGTPRKRADGVPYRWAYEMQGKGDPTLVDFVDDVPSGVAPLARIVAVKVLNQNGAGSDSTVIRGLEYVRKRNQESRDLKIHGANLSLGVPFNPKLYGCGYSPLCQEVTRAVRSGIVVVISCGNEGYGRAQISEDRRADVSLPMSISDPANAEEAIAVGSVHKGSPHTYGVSYFSSKGPTSDGRRKPDLVAPGEKIISCAIDGQGYEYCEMSGTSMAAPHVSGAIAAFLSMHKEFRGDPRAVKAIFMKSATDLNRDPNVQGAGLVDLMRAISSV
jgi:serine protease AprX